MRRSSEGGGGNPIENAQKQEREDLGILEPGTTDADVEATVDNCVNYAKDVSHALTLDEQGEEAADSILSVDSYSSPGLYEKDRRVVPAHFGVSSN